MSETVEQETDGPEGENSAGLTIGSLACSGVAVVLFFVSLVPDFGGEGVVWWWFGLALTVLVAALTVAVLKSDIPKRHKLIIAAGAAVPVFLYAYSLACTMLSS